MRIMFAGDWHGNTNFASAVIARAAEHDCTHVVQLGDFGFWPGEFGDRYLIELSNACSEHSVDLYVIHGNHDDPDRWQTYELNDDGFGVIADRMFFCPDGFRWEWDYLELGALGGAASIDREWREVRRREGLGRVWWPEEMITPEAVRDVAAPHFRTGEPHRLDILVTHEGPSWTGAGYAAGHPGMHFPIYDEARSAMCRALVDTAAQATRPWAHFHGHHHKRGIGYAPWHSPDEPRTLFETGVVIGLDADVNGSMVQNTHIIDTETDVPPLSVAL